MEKGQIEQVFKNLEDSNFGDVKSPAIGGKMAQLDKTYPTNDCSM
jgi:heterodisulfide reductase subunit A